MARPTLDINDKRSRRLTFRMTSREEEHMIKLMVYSNQPAAEVIRELVFKNRILQPRIPVLDQQTYGELKRIGTNLNQITKKLNMERYPGKIDPTLEELKAKLEYIIQHLIHDR